MAQPPEPPAPEPEEQSKPEDAAGLETPEESPEEQAEPPGTGGEDDPVNNGQHLMEKDPLAAATAGDTPTGQLENSLQIFEMSVAVEDLEARAEQGKMNLYTAGVFTALFFLGASRRYLEYAREVKN
ncbi:MAG: hypothetical protein BWY80_01450 [Firmicutes bacterium ADurb.Bin456]|nr:MAG: hypothetical protein BWY80_01450 [Firmicutes bacterium ADurb.Bin456]